MLIAEIAVPVPLNPNLKFFDYIIPESLQTSVQAGSFVTVPFGARKSWGIVWKIKNTSEAKKLKEIIELRLSDVLFDAKKRAFAEWLCEKYFYPIGEVCEALMPAAIRKASLKLLQPPKKKEGVTLDRPPLKVLNELQKKAFHDIESSNKKGHLLWGVTGSGKTEVYLHLIQQSLARGESSVVLVPEIALTPQLFQRFETAFPGEVAVFHSAQSDKEQRESWLSIFYEQKKIAVGPRSALFAPLKKLGLIIVDEEHEGSYKQEERLRYHARSAAEILAQLESAKLLLGSATPSAESLQKVFSDDYSMSQLANRAVPSSKVPTITVVDMKKNISQKTFDGPEQHGFLPQEVSFEQDSFFLSPELRKAVEQKKNAGEQMIFFLNRRGMGRALLCKSCGHQPECIQCAVNLIPHREKLLCHYCGFETSVPTKCSECGAEDTFRELGFGTEALETELHRLFPDLKTLRLDRDVVSDRKTLVDTLKSFSDKQADALIGTQMVAKGHDFPNVSLVGIVLADIGFSLPDFRNEERGFQLLTQVAGRAGRGEIPGEVILQSFRPNDLIFQEILKGESLEAYKEFMKRILESREFLNYPPFSHLALLQFQGHEQKPVQEAAHAVALALQKVKAPDFQVLGEVPSTIFKVRNKYRYQILIKSKSEEVLRKSLTWIWDKWVEGKMERHFEGTRLIIDVDPVQLL